MHEKKILVIGDIVADVYVDGRISRISREAPVLILEKAGEKVVAGGAANVVANVATLGVEVYATTITPKASEIFLKSLMFTLRGLFVINLVRQSQKQELLRAVERRSANKSSESTRKAKNLFQKKLRRNFSRRLIKFCPKSTELS